MRFKGPRELRRNLHHYQNVTPWLREEPQGRTAQERALSLLRSPLDEVSLRLSYRPFHLPSTRAMDRLTLPCPLPYAEGMTCDPL